MSDIKSLFGQTVVGKTFGIGQPKPQAPIAPPQIESEVSPKSSLLREQLRKKGLRSTILAGSNDSSSSSGGNTLLGGG